MSGITRNTRLPRRPQYVKVRLDADMAPEGPLSGGDWPGRERILTYHYFGAKRLRRGERVCVNEGWFKDVFGTVVRTHYGYRGYSFGIRRARVKQITVTTTVEVEKTAEVEVA